MRLAIRQTLTVAILGLVGFTAVFEAAHQYAAVIATIPALSRPHIVGVDPLTNRVYVSLLFSAGVKVIDGTTNTVFADFPVAARPSAVAVNPLTRRLYVTHGLTGQPGANTVEVLDADTGEVLSNIFVGGGPEFLRVNTVTNEVYVCQSFGPNIVVIDGASNSIVTAIPIGSDCRGIDIDEASNTIYATGRTGGKLVIIDGASHTVTDTVILGGHPWAVAVNPIRQRIYVTKDSLFVPGDTVTIIDSVTHDVLSTLAVGNRPLGVTVNPLTDRAYISHVGSNNIYILDAASEAISQILFSSGSGPFGIGINLLTDRIYVANAFSDTVSVIGHVFFPDLSVSLSDSPDPVLAGDDLTYTMVVTNNGPLTATGVTLSGALPPRIAGFPLVTPTQGTCAVTQTAVSCDLGTVAVGASATVAVTLRVARPGTISSTASVTANEPDPILVNNSDEETTTVTVASGPQMIKARPRSP